MKLTEVLAAFSPGGPAPASVLQEGVYGPGLYDPDENLTADQGGSLYFRRLSRSTRDLPPIVHERVLKAAYWLYLSNPLARRVIDVTRDYVVQGGVTVQARGDDDDLRAAQQDIIEKFWDDPDNAMDLSLYQQVAELGLYGEQIWSAAVNPVDGRVSLGYVDPEEVKDVIVDPKNTKIVRAVVLKGDGPNDSRYLKVINYDQTPGAKTYGRLVGAETDAQGQVIETLKVGDKEISYDGSCFFFAINKVSNAKRGQSDLATLIDWIDAYDQFLMNELDRSLLMKAFVFDVACQGMTEEQIKEYAKANGVPKPGSVRYHNEKITWAAVSPDLKTADAQIGADLLLGHTATGAGIPKLWLGGSVDVNFATARELSEFGFAKLNARQRFVRYMVERVIIFVHDCAELKGQLPRRADLKDGRPAPWMFVVTLPEIRARDLKSGADTTKAIVDAVMTARADTLIDEQVAQEAIAVGLSELGLDVDLEQMRERIEEEKAARAEAAEQVPPALPEGAAPPGEPPQPDGAPAFGDTLSEAWLHEAFDETKVARGPGGKFGSKPDSGDDVAGIDRPYRNADQRAADEKAAKAAVAAAKKAAKAGGKGAKGKAPKKLTKAQLGQEFGGLKAGDSVEVAFVGPNGEVGALKGTISQTLAGMPVLTYRDKQGEQKSVFLHAGIKNVVGVKTG